MGNRWKELRASFVAGLVIVVPVAASVLILLGFFTWLTNFLLPPALQDEMLTPLYRIAALLGFIVLTTILGWVTRLVIGRRLVTVGELVISRVPLLNKTYGFVKEISHTLLSGQKTVFQRVVLVEYPRPGVFTVGFVTSEAEGEIQVKTREQVINVFLPTTPNPTSGWLALIPRDKAIDLDMTVAEGMKLVISGGAVVPPYPPAGEPRSGRA